MKNTQKIFVIASLTSVLLVLTWISKQKHDHYWDEILSCFDGVTKH